MTHLLRPVLALLFAAVVGCGAPTTSGTPVTPGTPPSSDAAGPVFDDAPSTVVIQVGAEYATIDGPQGGRSTRVFGDGRIERTATDGIGTERLTLEEGGVQTLLEAAERLGLLSDPDLGDVMITDVGSTSLTIRLQDRTIDLEVIGPGITGVGSPSVEQARAGFSAFLGVLSRLDGIGIVQSPKVTHPQSIAVTAFPDDGSSEGSPWPLARPASSVFAASSCVLVSGKEVPRLAALLAEQRQRPSARRDSVRVATGDIGLPSLVFRLSWRDPQCTPAPTERTPLPRLPWPADDRERSGQWQRWQADGALDRAADRYELPIGDPGYLKNYEFQYVSGTVAGGSVVDVVATPDEEHTGRDDIPPFVARIGLTSVDGPAVIRLVRT